VRRALRSLRRIEDVPRPDVVRALPPGEVHVPAEIHGGPVVIDIREPEAGAAQVGEAEIPVHHRLGGKRAATIGGAPVEDVELALAVVHPGDVYLSLAPAGDRMDFQI
jgi:hypothetical protein